MKATPITMTTREGFKVGQCVKLVDLTDGEVYMNEGLREGAFGVIMHINKPGYLGQLITVYFPCINKERHMFSHRFVPWFEAKESSFKIGQFLEVVDPNKTLSDFYSLGDIVVVERIGLDGGLYVKNLQNGLTFYGASRRFLPARTKDNYSAGDIVMIVKNDECDFLGYDLVGTTAVVADHDGYSVALRLEDRESPFRHGCLGLTPRQYGLYAPKETLVLLKDAEELKTADEPKFKVGDKVRVTKQMFSKDKPVGFVGKIGTVDCGEYYFENDDLYYEESQLELVINEIEEPTGEVFDRGRKELLEIQVDRVIYTGNKTILHYTAPNSGRTGRVVAKCHPEDKFDKEIGYKVALLKAFQESIPYTIKRMTESED